MIRWFYKYGFVLLLLVTILMNLDLDLDGKPDYKSMADFIFFLLMGSGLLFLIINPAQIKDVIFHKSFLFLLLINVINLIYFLFFEYSKYGFNQESFKFLMARFVQFAFISLAVYHNYDYYKRKFLSFVLKVIYCIVILGVFVNQDLFSGEYSGIIWNQNMLASLTGISLMILLLKEKNHSNFEIIMLIFLILISILTGSRSVFIFISFAFLYKYGFSIRNVLYAIIGVFLLFNIQHRILYSELDRIDQWQESINNIEKSPWLGYGLLEYDGEIGELQDKKGIYGGAHNAYLSLFMQYGLVFGSLVIFIILRKSLLLFFVYRSVSMSYLKIYLCVIMITLTDSFFETLITGINEFHTILFWFCLAYLSHSRFLKDYETI